MPEATPRPFPRKFAVPAALAAAFALGAGLTWMLGRGDAPPPSPPEESPRVLVVPPPLPPIPPLSRADLLAAARAAASAYAGGSPADQAALVGRRFQVRVAFGCTGPLPPTRQAGGPQAGWRYDEARQTLTLTARPVVWTDAPQIAGAGEDVEAVEGFWIPRPWTDAESCPAAPPAAATAPAAATDEPGPDEPATPPAPAPQTLGLASIFRTDGSRVLRRGERPYEVVRKMAPADLNASGGFRLVLSGRVAALGDGQPVACRADAVDRPPVCLVAVEFDRVAFEDAAGVTIAEWRS